MISIKAKRFFNAEFGFFNISSGHIDFINNRNYFKIIFHSKIKIRDSLGLNPLSRINDKKNSVARSKSTRYFVGKVNMPRCVDKIENIIFAVFSTIFKSNGISLNRNSPFPLDIHRIKHLIDLIAVIHETAFFDYTVGKRAFSVIDMCNNREISYVFHLTRHSYELFVYKET
ncbi:MAG: hypothetical protein BWY90_00845 [Deltaproteobacteria bacterium ADurb.BinA014]|nr:MAG: hypothetical protein BWY90_00845 [Deltaproteobacteria bacterium ADurb.BinA014]